MRPEIPVSRLYSPNRKASAPASQAGPQKASKRGRTAEGNKYNCLTLSHAIAGPIQSFNINQVKCRTFMA